MSKYKRTILIVVAVLFLFVLFFLKTTSFKNTETYESINKENGLTYDNLTIEDLVNKDTDGDKILDWQENLYGLDPNKRETTPGIPDKIAIEKLKSQIGQKEQGESLLENINTENLTETEKFSRELFATIAAANQNGVMDQAAIDKLSISLADNIKNTPPRKIFSILDIKTINNDTTQAFKDYNNALNNIYIKYPPVNYTILDVLQKFVNKENEIDTDALIKLNPIIEQMNKVIVAMVKTSVPQSISTLHLNVINSQERLAENLSDIKLYDNDAIIALSGISKYEENANKLESDINNLANAINQKLKN